MQSAELWEHLQEIAWQLDEKPSLQSCLLQMFPNSYLVGMLTNLIFQSSFCSLSLETGWLMFWWLFCNCVIPSAFFFVQKAKNSQEDYSSNK